MQALLALDCKGFFSFTAFARGFLRGRQPLKSGFERIENPFVDSKGKAFCGCWAESYKRKSKYTRTRKEYIYKKSIFV